MPELYKVIKGNYKVSRYIKEYFRQLYIQSKMFPIKNFPLFPITFLCLITKSKEKEIRLHSDRNRFLNI